MNMRIVMRALARILWIIALFMLSAVAISCWSSVDSTRERLGLFLCALTTASAGLLMAFAAGRRRPDEQFGIREGFAVVAFGWLAAALFGGLPFVALCGMWPHDAFFESMSGFTTTGASVIDNTLRRMDGTPFPRGLADLPDGVLFWRSMTNWLGGMGIIILALAVLPSLGISAHQLYNAEATGPVNDRISPRVAESAKILWGVYCGMTALLFLLLCLAGLSMFDAICTAFGTVATGGFSCMQDSIAAYGNPWVEGLVTLFMFLSGANFVLHYRALRGEPKVFLRDEEFRFYAWVTLLAVAIVSFSLAGRPSSASAPGGVAESTSVLEAFRHGSFQVVSIMTTTGFATADFGAWPACACLALALLMFLGGCGGSTSGGIKASRILLLAKYALAHVRRCIFPHSVVNIRLNDMVVPTATVYKTLGFFFIYATTFAVVTFLLTVFGVDDLVTAATASAASIGNVGPGLGKVGPVCTYAWMSPPAKVLLALAMLMGRLEIYTVLVVLLPAFWRR